MQYYKALNAEGRGPYSGVGWNLPSGGKPGEWMPKVAEVVECKSGYHICRRKDLVYWLEAQIYEVEVRGVVEEYSNKCATQEARLLRKLAAWNDTTVRLFAADCAEQVLPIFEKLYPKDMRPREAIEAARKFARGEITDAARAAAWSAARDAAQDAVQDAAWSAARAAARAAVRAAAQDAVQDAARAAVQAAAGAAARVWQTEKLFEYLEESAA